MECVRSDHQLGPSPDFSALARVDKLPSAVLLYLARRDNLELWDIVKREERFWACRYFDQVFEDVRPNGRQHRILRKQNTLFDLFSVPYD